MPQIDDNAILSNESAGPSLAFNTDMDSVGGEDQATTTAADSNANQVNKILFTEKVQHAIEQVLHSGDPLDCPDFNPTDYINHLFPTEQSLSSIDDVIVKMECECGEIDDNIRSVVRGQTTTGQDGRRALAEAQNVITHLFGQITEIKTRAEKTEDMVKEITRDIKQLDCAKKNLTAAITTLNHLHILVGGIENLSKLVDNRQYGELLNPLQAIIEVNKHFQQYSQIPQIQDLSDQVDKIQKELATQITNDFQHALTNSSKSNSIQHGDKLSLAQLTDACMVVSVLEDSKIKMELLKWFIALQLQEYQQLFHENEDIAWIAKIDKRYAWLKRHLLDFEDKLGKIFPVDWEVSERITVQFCLITRDSLGAIMHRRRTEIDVKLLLFAISKTQQFEMLLAKRFTGETYQQLNTGNSGQAHNQRQSSTDILSTEQPSSGNGSVDNVTGAGDKETVQSPFIDMICVCFKPFLDIYTDSVDRNLAEIMERFVQESSNVKTNAAINNSAVFPSCADLFVFYKKCLVQCTQLSTEKPMYQLSQIFKKYLREYASKILESKIPKMSAPQTTLGTSMSMLTKDLQNLSTAAGHVIHSLLKEGDQPRYSRDDIIRICCILTTAEYCLETVEQLESKLKEKCDATYSDQIDLSDEKDLFHRCISNCIHLMVQDLENGCEPALIVMNRIQWQNIQNVGDQSPFVNSITANFKSSIPTVRDNLASSRKYYTQFCQKFVHSFIPKYINALYKCRLMTTTSSSTSSAAAALAADQSNASLNSSMAALNVSAQSASFHHQQQSNILGCEQLLLDTHSLKTVLLDLPSIGSQIQRKAPASYTKVVVKGMTKAEMIIKIVMQPISPAQTFIEQYLKMLPESSYVEFNKVMDMKGLKRSDSTHLLDIYKRHAPRETMNASNADGTDDGYTSLNTSENIITSTIKQTANNVTSSLSASADKGRIRKLENLIKKRLP